MFSSLLKKLSGGSDSSIASGAFPSSNAQVGSSRLSDTNRDWSAVYNHNIAMAEGLKRYVKTEQSAADSAAKQNNKGSGSASEITHKKINPKNEGCVGDYDGKVSFRAEASVGSPFPNAKLVAYDTTRQLIAVLSDSISLTTAKVGANASSSAVYSLSTTAPPVAATTAGGSCVYIVGTAGGSSQTPFVRAVLVRDNEDWEEMLFIEGYHILVLRSERTLCFVDTRSSTSAEVEVQQEHYMLPLHHEASRVGVSAGGPFTCGTVLSQPLVGDGPNATAGGTLTALCRSMPVGLGSIAVGTSDGRVLFAPLNPPSAGTPMVWRKYSGHVKTMLDTLRVPNVEAARNATRRHFEMQYIKEKKREENAKKAGRRFPVVLPQDHLLDSVTCIAAYASNPNAYLTSTRNSHGVLKWYVLENRRSAMFVLPHCFVGHGQHKHPVIDADLLGFQFEKTYVTAVAVTAGGGFVTAVTNKFHLVIWHEKEDKRSTDKSVPPLSCMNLLLSHPMISQLSSLPDNQSGSDDDDALEQEDGPDVLGATGMANPRLVTANAHKLLLSVPEHIFIMNTVTPSNYAVLTESASVVEGNGGVLPIITPSALSAKPTHSGNGSKDPFSSSSLTDSQFITLFIPSQQVQYSGSAVTSMLATEQGTVMTEVRLDSETMELLTIRHVPLQSHTAPLSFSTHVKTRSWDYCLFNQYPVKLSVIPCIPNCPWPSDRVCGLLLNAPQHQQQLMNATNSRLSMTISGGRGSEFRGSVRGSIVLAATVNAMCNPECDALQLGEGEDGLHQHMSDTPPPFAADGSPASLACFAVAATIIRNVHHEVSAGVGSSRVTVSIRNPVGDGFGFVHRVVDRLPISSEQRSEENGGTDLLGNATFYFNASYRSVPVGTLPTESLMAASLKEFVPVGNNLSITTSPHTVINTTNQLVLLRAHHRRLLHDCSKSLQGRLSQRVGKATAQCNAPPRSSSSATYVMDGGGKHPFLCRRTNAGASRTKAPYFGTNAEDVGVLAIWKAVRTTSSIINSNPSSSALPSAPLLNAIRLYPFSNLSSAAPSSSILQMLVGYTGGVPRPISRGPSPVLLLAEEQTIGIPQSLFEGSMMVTLIERKEYYAPRQGDATAQIANVVRCKVVYTLKVITQRHINDEAACDDDTENEEYESITAPPSDTSNTVQPPAGCNTQHNFVLSSGLVPIPYVKVLAPQVCAGYHDSVVDEDGCAAVPTPQSLRRDTLASTETVATQRLPPLLPTIKEAKVVYGAMLKRPAGSTIPGPQRVFSPNEGLSMLFVLSDNTVLLISIIDIVSLNEQLEARLSSPSASNAPISLPHNALCIPTFLFPSEAIITAADVFSVPIVIPSSWFQGAARQPESRSSYSDPIGDSIPLLPSASLFAPAHTLVLAAGMSDGSLFLFDTSKEVVLGCLPITPSCRVGHNGGKGDGAPCSIISLSAATPANGTFSYSPAAEEPSITTDEVLSKAPNLSSPSHVALHANPFGAPTMNKPNLLHESVYEGFTIPCYGAVEGNTVTNNLLLQRPLYCWYPRSCLSRIPPQIPMGCVDKVRSANGQLRRGQRGASIGGCGFMKMELTFGGGMTTLSEVLQSAVCSSSKVAAVSGSVVGVVTVRPLMTAQLLDVFGFPLLGLEMGIGVTAESTNSSIVKTVHVRVSDTQLLSQNNTAPWVAIDPKRLPFVSGLAVTRELDTGLAIITLCSVPSAVEGDDVEPEVVFTAKLLPPLGVRIFNSRRVSCCNIRAHIQGPFTFSTMGGSNVSVEIVDALDDNIRLFGVDMMQMPAVGGSLPIGGVVTGAVRQTKGGVPAKAKVPQLPSLHDFPLSRNFTTAAYGGATGGDLGFSGGGDLLRPIAAIAPSKAQHDIMMSLLQSCTAAGNSKALLAALDAALDAVNPSSSSSLAATHQYYPSLVATLSSISDGTVSSYGHDVAVASISVKGLVYAIQYNCINWMRALLHQSPDQPRFPSAPVPLPTFVATSLRSLLAVAVRHNNLCEKGLSEWVRSNCNNNTNVGTKRQIEVPKVSFDDRMQRIEKGLPPEPVDVSTHNAVEGSDYESEAMRTIGKMFKGPWQGGGGFASSRCPYTDFMMPNVVSSFVVLGTSQQGHNPDELVAVRLGVRIDEAEEGNAYDNDDDGVAQLAHVPWDKQRSYVFVAFTTETNPSHEYHDCVVDVEEGLYAHSAMMKGDNNDCGAEASDGAVIKSKGIVRQGGIYRSHIAVFDVSMATFEAESHPHKPGTPFRSLTPIFVYPIPLSSVSSSHVLTGFDIHWCQGQAHCYFSSSKPHTSVDEGVDVLSGGPSAQFGHRHSRTHHLAHVVIDDGTDDLDGLGDASDDDDNGKGKSSSPLKKPSLGIKVRMCPPTHLTWEGTVMRSYNPFTTCDFVGVSSARRREMEMACLQRVVKEVELRRQQMNGGGGATHYISAGKPPTLGKEVIGYYLPQPPSNLAATQKEQGFFKRLATSSFADQLEKLEKGPLLGISEVDFGSFYASAQSAALRNLTPAERRAMLLQSSGGRSSAAAGSGSQQGRAQGAMSGINETKSTMNENLQLLSERGEKIDRLRLKTREMHEEAATFADLAAQLKAKQRKSWF